ncbi:hypothetical protein RUM44_004075 [Polyplax serrata]|uniref:Uncharacterized protein n=1 Tax=Polyplax serrata TaxID=468196 RepID=A0ABR1B3D2_POLSC
MFEIIKEIEETLRDFFHYTRVDAPDTVSGSGTAMTPGGALHGTVLHGAASNSGALGVASPQEPTYVNL